MRKAISIGVLLVLACHTTLGEERAAANLSRQIIAGENARLTEAVRSKRVLMFRARMSRAHASAYRHSIARMESTITAHNLTLNQGQADLLVRSAQAIVHGDLERHYSALHETRNMPETIENKDLKTIREREQELIGELTVLKEWQNQQLKATDKPAP